MKRILILFLLLVCMVEGRGGVYFYRNRRDNKVHYVGMTNNFDRRNREHKFDSRKYRMDRLPLKTGRNIWRKVEKYYIKKYRPIYNQILF